MFTARKKILKEKNAEPDVFEESVAQVIGKTIASRPSVRCTSRIIFDDEKMQLDASGCIQLHMCHTMRHMPFSAAPSQPMCRLRVLPAPLAAPAMRPVIGAVSFPSKVETHEYSSRCQREQQQT